MSFGRINYAQMEAIKPHIQGRVVHDLGSGDLALAQGLLCAGAREIIAVDKEARKPFDTRIRMVESLFINYAESINTAFVSWPINHTDHGLLSLVKNAYTVIYVGKNTDGMACGTIPFFDILIDRQVLAYVPDKINSLIIYGYQRVSRPLLGEEMAALNNDRIWRYEEAEFVTQSAAVQLPVR